MNFKSLKVISFAGLVALAPLTQAAFPERTIENIFPWGAGMAMSVSQIIAKAMGEELGVSIQVVSTPGAGGTKAFKTAMKRPADGYTIFDGYVAPLVLQPVLGKADWTYEEFKPLHSAVSNAFSIGIRKGETRFKNFQELVQFGQANPGKLRYSSGSRNNLPHMVIAKVLQSHNVVAQNIPYKTDGDARKDLKSGVLDFAFINIGAYLQDKEGYEVVLVLSELEGAKRSYDGAPSVADLGIDTGLSGLAPMGWTWWLVHKDTPEDKANTLRMAMKRALNRKDVIEQIERVGFVILGYDHTQYDSIVGPVSGQLGAMGNALKWEEDELKKLK